MTRVDRYVATALAAMTLAAPFAVGSVVRGDGICDATAECAVSASRVGFATCAEDDLCWNAMLMGDGRGSVLAGAVR